MNVRTDPEEVETTRSEKVLAFVLATFILIGATWAYSELDEVDRPTSRAKLELAARGTADVDAISRHQAATREVHVAEGAVDKSRRNLEVKREAFRTALEAGEPVRGPRAAYERAERDFAIAERAVREANRRATRTAGPAAAAQATIDRAERRVARQLRDEERSHGRLVFALRLGLVLLMLGGGYLLLSRMRSRRSRYLPLALAAIGSAAAMALGLAADYATDYVDVEELGALALSLAGIAMTVAAFAALQRYVAKQIPPRRVRRHECPFCGFPVRENANCEGCGRRVVGQCSACNEARRVGTAHCGACGAA